MMIQKALLLTILLIVVFFVMLFLPTKRIEFLYEIDNDVPASALLLFRRHQFAAEDRLKRVRGQAALEHTGHGDGNTAGFLGYDHDHGVRVLAHADACPVVAIVEQIAKEYEIPVTLLCDTNHVLYSDYSEVVTVGAGADAVDFKLVSLCHKGDIVVTQDYGVAAMILGKGAYGIHQNGKWYTNENIDRMLMERHLAKKARNAKKKHHLKGPSKRTDEDDRRFAESFTRLVEKRLKTENEA